MLVAARLYDANCYEEISVDWGQTPPIDITAFGPGGKTLLWLVGPGTPGKLKVLRADVTGLKVLRRDESRKRLQVEVVELKEDHVSDLFRARTCSPDGVWLVAQGSEVGSNRQRWGCALWNTTTGESRALKGMEAEKGREALGFSFAPDNRRVAAWFESGTAYVYETADGRLVGAIPTKPSERGSVTVVAFAPDGKTLVAGTNRGEIVLVDLPERKKP